MKAAVFTEVGRAPLLTELADPVIGPDELLLRVEACGVCHSDLHLVDGDWMESLARRVTPTIFGHEIVGRVLDRGSSVRSIEKGDRVGVGWVGETCGCCEQCVEGNDNLCAWRQVTGIDRQGGWATHVAVHTSQVVRLPDGLDPCEVAPLFCAGVTVYRGMKKARIRAGDRVAIFGVGGLGHLAVQLARMWRAETTAVDPGASRLELARELGARHTVAPEGAAHTLQAAGGTHVAVVTAASTSAYDEALRSLRKGGTLVVIGLPNDTLQFVADDLATREIHLVGSAVGSRQDARELLDLAAGGKIRCEVERLHLDAVGDALQRLREGRVRGRIVLVP
jgi:propanol-preferring alcohol dehydrogenase